MRARRAIAAALAAALVAAGTPAHAQTAGERDAAGTTPLPPTAAAQDTSVAGFLRSLADSSDAFFGISAAAPDTEDSTARSPFASPTLTRFPSGDAHPD